MRLPNFEQSIIDTAKLRGYCLNSSHPEGRHKARVFFSALGIGPADADWLRDAILAAIRETEVSSTEQTPYGTRIDVDVVLERAGRSATVRTGWIVRKSDSIPRLATCFVK